MNVKYAILLYTSSRFHVNLATFDKSSNWWFSPKSAHYINLLPCKHFIYRRSGVRKSQNSVCWFPVQYAPDRPVWNLTTDVSTQIETRCLYKWLHHNCITISTVVFVTIYIYAFGRRSSLKVHSSYTFFEKHAWEYTWAIIAVTLVSTLDHLNIQPHACTFYFMATIQYLVVHQLLSFHVTFLASRSKRPKATSKSTSKNLFLSMTSFGQTSPIIRIHHINKISPRHRIALWTF